MPNPFEYGWGGIDDPTADASVYDPSGGEANFYPWLNTVGYGSVYDYYSFASDQDELSNLSTLELAEYMASYGYEYLENENFFLPGGLSGEVDTDALINEFVSNFTSLGGDVDYSPFAAFDDTYITQEAAIATAQQQALLDSFETSQGGDWEVLQAQLSALETMNEYSISNMERDYGRDMMRISDSQDQFLNSQMAPSQQMKKSMGRSGLSGGRLSRQASLMKENIANSLQQINLQKRRAQQEYTTNLSTSSDLYTSQQTDFEDDFYANLNTAQQDLDFDLDNIANQFNASVNSMYDDWYVNLLSSVGTFGATDPTVTVGDYEYDWSPFGLDFDPSDAVNYIGPDPNHTCGPTGEDECTNTYGDMEGTVDNPCPGNWYFSNYCNSCVDPMSAECP